MVQDKIPPVVKVTDECWYVIGKNQKAKGPYSLLQLEKMARRKKLSSRTILTRRRSTGKTDTRHLYEVIPNLPHSIPLSDFREIKDKVQHIFTHKHLILVGVAIALSSLFLYENKIAKNSRTDNSSTKEIMKKKIFHSKSTPSLPESQLALPFANCSQTKVHDGLELARSESEQMLLSNVKLSKNPCPNCLVRAKLSDGTNLVLIFNNITSYPRSSTLIWNICGSLSSKKARQAYIKVKGMFL